MKIVDIADEIYRELANPTDLTIPAIAFWLRTNIGALNNLINADLTVNEDTLEFSTDLDDKKKSILKKLYMIHHYELKIRSTLGAAASDPVVEVSSEGDRVRKINKNELSKTYLSIKRQEVAELNELVKSHKISEISPVQVAGDDTVEGAETEERSFNRYKPLSNY